MAQLETPHTAFGAAVKASDQLDSKLQLHVDAYIHAHHSPLHPRPALRRTLEVRRPRAIGQGLLVAAAAGAAGCRQGRSAWCLVVCTALRCRAAAGDVAVGGSAARHALAAGAGRCGAGSARADAALAGAAQRRSRAQSAAVLHAGAAGGRRGRAATAVRGANRCPQSTFWAWVIGVEMHQRMLPAPVKPWPSCRAPRPVALLAIPFGWSMPWACGYAARVQVNRDGHCDVDGIDGQWRECRCLAAITLSPVQRGNAGPLAGHAPC